MRIWLQPWHSFLRLHRGGERQGSRDTAVRVERPASKCVTRRSMARVTEHAEDSRANEHAPVQAVQSLRGGYLGEGNRGMFCERVTCMSHQCKFHVIVALCNIRITVSGGKRHYCDLPRPLSRGLVIPDEEHKVLQLWTYDNRVAVLQELRAPPVSTHCLGVRHPASQGQYSAQGDRPPQGRRRLESTQVYRCNISHPP